MIEKTIITLGDIGVGKTSIILRLTTDIFHENPVSTIGIRIFKIGNQYHSKELKDLNMRLTFLDTLGREAKFSLPKNYLRDVDKILLVYDITNEESFNSLKHWIKIVEEKLIDTESLFVLVGTKLDLSNERNVNINQINMLIEEKNISHKIEISSKSKKNLDNLVNILTNEPLRKSTIDNIKIEKDKIEDNEKKKGICC
jgi:small GTP-binding protein